MRLSLVAALLCLVFAAGCSKGADPRPPALEARPSATAQAQTERQRPPANLAPVTAPAAATVLAMGDALPFTVCSQRTAWQKPDAGEMEQVFTDRRFGDGVAPDPSSYSLYLTPFYFLDPFGAAVNKYSNAFGGFWDNSGSLEQFCDLAQLRADYDRQGGLHGFTPVGYRTVEVRLQGSDLVIVVEPGFGGWQQVIYPYPADDSALLNSRTLITTRQVVDTSSRLLYQDLWPVSGVAWQQSLQYDASGSLRAVVIGGILPYASAPISVGEGQEPLALYSSSPAQTVAAGHLRVIDVAGAEVARIDWQPGVPLWQPLGSVSLQPGTYRLLFEEQGSDWHHFVLLASNVALPPGVQ